MTMQIAVKELTTSMDAERFVNDFCRNKNIMHVDIKPIYAAGKTRFLVTIQYKL